MLMFVCAAVQQHCEHYSEMRNLNDSSASFVSLFVSYFQIFLPFLFTVAPPL